MLKYLKFDYTVIISLLGKGEWYELFLQQEESENLVYREGLEEANCEGD